jgi:hypothetical protein
MPRYQNYMLSIVYSFIHPTRSRLILLHLRSWLAHHDNNSTAVLLFLPYQLTLLEPRSMGHARALISRTGGIVAFELLYLNGATLPGSSRKQVQKK